MPSSTLLRRALALPLAFLLACALVVATSQTEDASASQNGGQVRLKKIKKATAIAKAQLGDPYSYGASGPDSFDCSGFTSYAYGQAGITIPRTSDAQAQASRVIPRSQLKRGDLMFFHSGGNVYHVGMFWSRDDGQAVMINAPRTGSNVSFAKTWTDSWFAGTFRPKGVQAVSAPLLGNHTAKPAPFKLSAASS